MNHSATHLTRLASTCFATVMSVLVLSGTAFAYTDPIRPESGVGQGGGAGERAATPTLTSSGWSLSAVVAVTVLALLVGWIARVAVQHIRDGRRVQSPALGV
ncbi:MAG TPA: hypothetical protein VIJ54_10865 [Actinomycetes bacterium]